MSGVWGHEIWKSGRGGRVIRILPNYKFSLRTQAMLIDTPKVSSESVFMDG